MSAVLKPVQKIQSLDELVAVAKKAKSAIALKV